MCFKCIKCSLHMFFNPNDVNQSSPLQCPLQLQALNTESVWQDMLCVAKNSCRDKVERTGIFSWRRNKSPMQHFSECFCHIVLNMAQNIQVDMLIHRISLYDISAMNNSMNVRKQSACSSFFTQTCLAYLKYRDDRFFQWKNCCKQCDNSERGCVPITAFPHGPDKEGHDSCTYQSAMHEQILQHSTVVWFKWDSQSKHMYFSSRSVITRYHTNHTWHNTQLHFITHYFPLLHITTLK